MNISNVVDALINRAKQLTEFEIYSYVDGPIQFDGVVPFNISINKNVATFKVFALSKEEAKHQVDEWLKDRT